MISKAHIKLIKSLEQKKFRRQLGLFVAEGAKIADELIPSSFTITKIYATSSWLNSRRELLEGRAEAELHEVTEEELERISFLTTAQQVLMLVQGPQISYTAPDNGQLNLALDSIRDPGNMGSIIRLADWYGLKRIYCSTDCVDVYSPKVVQASMGSIARVDVIYCEIEEVLKTNGLNIYAAVLGGDLNLHKLDAFKGGMLLIGNEGQGLQPGLLKHATHKVEIPRFGQAESLNAAIATGIFLDNFRRLMH